MLWVLLVTGAAAVVAVLVLRRPGLAEAAVRNARIRLRAHRLADLHHGMVRQALEQRVPGLTQDYLPNRLEFGWHPSDMARWAQLRGHVEAETSQILRHAAIDRGYLLVGEIVVVIAEDAGARPGRASLLAGSRTGATNVSTMTQLNATRPRSPEPCPLLLTRDGAAPERLRVTDELVVGRHREAGLRIADDTVSARHARFTVTGTELRVADLGSVNGTFVNGARIDGESSLASGDIVAFGDALDRVVVGHR